MYQKLITMILVLVMCLGFIPAAASIDVFDDIDAIDIELLAMPEDSLLEIDDGVIRITIDAKMNMVVFKKDGGEWTPITKQIEKMGAAGATASGVAGAWANALPWSANTGTSTSATNPNFIEASAKILSQKTSYVTTGNQYREASYGQTGLPTSAGNDSGEQLLSDSFVLIDAAVENNVKTYFSKGATGQRLTVVGLDTDLGMSHRLVLETGAVPGTIAVSSYYTYVKLGSLAVTKFVDNNFMIEAAPLDKLVVGGDTKRAGGLWSWQGCDAGATQGWAQNDRVYPVLDTMGIGSTANINAAYVSTNLMSRNNWHWSRVAGIAYNFFWGSDFGVGIGSIMPYHVYGLELPVRGSGIAGNHNIGYTWVGWPGRTLVSGKEEYIGTSIVGVIDGDMGDGLDMYARSMDNVDIAPFVDSGTFVKSTDPSPGASDWSYIVDGFDYAKPRFEYVYGDSYYNGVPNNLIVMPSGDEVPEWAIKPNWETFGYGSTIPTLQIFYMVPVLQKLGYGTLTYEGGWRDTSGSLNMGSSAAGWGYVAPLLEEYFNNNPHSKHKTPGDAYDFTGLNMTTQTARNRVVRAMNEYIHEHGMRVNAWVQDVLISNTHITSGRVPAAWGIQNYTNTGRNGSYGCTGNPEFINAYTTYYCELMFGEDYRGLGFDGLKGDSFWGTDRCYGVGHGHDGDPDAPIRNYGLYFKNVYNKANYIRGATEYVGGPIVNVDKVASIKQCMCGRTMDYFVQPGVNRPISGDHSGTKANRQLNRIWRGIYGWEVPMSSDHHDLDMRDDEMFRPILENIGEFDYANLLGTGILFESKTRINLHGYHNATSERSSLMTWPGEANYSNRWPRYTTSGGNNLPWANGAIKWGAAVKYYGLQHDFGTTQSRMLGGLYKYVVDFPEAYALELMDKDPVTGALTAKPVSERIYSFYATSFPIEADDPRVIVDASASPCRFYREVMLANTQVFARTFDPWNSVDKGLENTTADRRANIPFTFNYQGPIEIRGLKAFTSYCLTDLETGAKMYKTSDAFGNIAFETEFKNSVVYHVTEAASGAITGRVYDDSGALLSGATITLYNKDDEKVFWDTASDMDGYYSFPVVPAGEYYIKHTFPKSYVTPLSGTAAVPNNDSRYAGFVPVNLDYFDNVYEYYSAPFTVGNTERTIDLGLGAQPLGRVDGIPISIDYVGYDVWLEAYSKLEGVNAVEIVFSFDGGDMLSYLGFGGALAELGFTPLNLDAGAVGGVTWTKLPNGWRGKLLLGLSAKNVDLAGIIEKLITLSFQASSLGEVTLTVESLKISSLPEGGKVRTVEVNFPGGSESYTTAVHAFHPRYDLNKDGKVDIKDISIALAAITWVNTAPGWDSKQIALTDAGAVITPSMIDVSQNLLGDGVIDILDVLDILRNFT